MKVSALLVEVVVDEGHGEGARGDPGREGERAARGQVVGGGERGAVGGREGGGHLAPARGVEGDRERELPGAFGGRGAGDREGGRVVVVEDGDRRGRDREPRGDDAHGQRLVRLVEGVGDRGEGEHALGGGGPPRRR